MLEINYTLLIQIANFLVLLFALNIFLFKPIRAILQKRQEETSRLEEVIEDFRLKADKSESGLEENKILAQKEGQAEKGHLKAKGVEQEQGILKEAAASAETRITEAKKDMEGKIAEVREALEDQISRFSGELAAKILGRSV
ncbi:MAG: ATP synthase F0 subunit B [Desulfatiglans sp.]|jgi:F-type H+-transporting ATPase subunit b|nr:ATP synthase F0 subunit B [Thermodesulfobacteriota bacterium]MEE4352953.1 ATP synthase F0 subunit B [Desulfatiglans sp.]